MMIYLTKHRVLLGLLFLALASNLSFWDMPTTAEFGVTEFSSRASDRARDRREKKRRKRAKEKVNKKEVREGVKECFDGQAKGTRNFECDFEATYGPKDKDKTDFEKKFEVRLRIEDEDRLASLDETEGGFRYDGDDSKTSKELIAEICGDKVSDIEDCPKSKRYIQKTIVEFKIKDCSDCEWSTLVDPKKFKSIKLIAKAIEVGLNEEGKYLLEEYQQELKVAEAEEACQIDEDGEDLTSLNRVDERVACVIEKDLDGASKADRRRMYDAGLKTIVQELLRSTDPRLREKGRTIVTMLWQDARANEHTSLMAELDATMIRAESMEGLVQLTARCTQNGQAGQILPGPQQNNASILGGQSFGINGTAPTSCMLSGTQALERDLIVKTYGLANHYRGEVSPTEAQVLARQFSQQFAQEKNQAIQNPQQYLQARFQSVLDVGTFDGITNGGGLASLALGGNQRFTRNTGNSSVVNNTGAFRGGQALPGLTSIPQVGSPFNGNGGQNIFANSPNNLAGTLYPNPTTTGGSRSFRGNGPVLAGPQNLSLGLLNNSGSLSQPLLL